MSGEASRKQIADMTPAARKFFFDYWQNPTEPKRLIDWAVDQLTAGGDSASLRILAGLPESDHPEADLYFRNALAELNDAIPDQRECIIYYSWDVARAIVQMQLSPFDGFSLLWEIADELNYPDALERWRALNWELDLMEVKGVAQTEREAVIYGECERFLELRDAYTATGLARFTLEESLAMLRKDGWEVPVTLDEIPKEMPKPDDEIQGISFFRMGIEEGFFRDLTIPRTLFLHSELKHCHFENADLTNSAMTRCDWHACNFARADLRGCDLRKSVFNRCHFGSACLDGADLRDAQFQDCTFTEASMHGTKLQKTLGLFAAMCSKELKLSDDQVNEITWVTTPGEEPPGG